MDLAEFIDMGSLSIDSVFNVVTQGVRKVSKVMFGWLVDSLDGWLKLE